MIFNKIRNLITSRNASAVGGGPADTHTLPTDLVPIAELLSVPFSPRAEFLDSLERQLLRAQVTRSGSAFPPLRLPRARWLVRIAVAAAVLAATIAAMFVASGRGSQPEVASAMVLADATQKLLGLHTVRYETRAEISHGICYTGYNAPLTEEEKAALAGRGEKSSDTGIVYGCYAGPQVISETGIYDLDRRAFSATKRLVEGETGITFDGPGPYDPNDRMFVDGKLYLREAGGEWRIQPTQNRWMPFSFEGFGAVPAGNLNALKGQYDQVIKIGGETLDGARVAHYRASRISSQGPETVEAWIGVEDGLPRRAIITVETENSEEWHLKHINDRLDSDPVAAKYKNDPIFLRGKWPSEKVITYTYTFSDFNEPVEIEAPIP